MHHIIVLVPLGPFLAAPRKLGQHARLLHQPLNLAGLLEELDRQAIAGMPRNMAMHQPGARVVDAERNPQIPVYRAIGHVTTRRVVQLGHNVLGEGTLSLGEHQEVMSV